MLGFQRKKAEAKEDDFRDKGREAFEAELERVQKAQELDRQRKLEEKEHAVEMAQKKLEDRERQAREEERQAREEEAAKEAAARVERKPWKQLSRWRMSARLERTKSDSCYWKKNEGRKTHVASRWSLKNVSQNEKLIAKREAENKQQEAARENVEEKPVNVWQRGEEEELSRLEDVDREEEERMVASIRGNAQDDDDRAPLQLSVGLSYSQVSQRALHPEISPIIKPSEVQNPFWRVNCPSEFRGSNVSPEPERRDFGNWRREQPADSVIGSAAQTYPSHSRNENIDLQASISRDRVYNGRRCGDKGAVRTFLVSHRREPLENSLEDPTLMINDGQQRNQGSSINIPIITGPQFRTLKAEL